MLLAVESQTAIHYAAPLKVMLYDSMEYAEQVGQMERTSAPSFFGGISFPVSKK